MRIFKSSFDKYKFAVQRGDKHYSVGSLGGNYTIKHKNLIENSDSWEELFTSTEILKPEVTPTFSLSFSD